MADGLDSFSADVPVDAPLTPKDTERALLACVLCDEGRDRVLDRVAARLSPEDFTERLHAAVWAAMLAARERGDTVDSANVNDELLTRRDEAARKYLSDLALLVTDSSRAEEYARRVAERAYLRVMKRGVREMMGLLDADVAPLDAVNSARTKFAELPRDVAGARDDSMKAGVCEALEDIERAMANGAETAAVWGLGSLDGGKKKGGGWIEGALGGMFPGELHVLGGVPAAGKTTLAWQSVIATARKGRRVLVFSMEMTRRELVKRLAGQKCGLNGSRIKRGAINQAEMTSLQTAMGELARMPVHIDNDSRTLERLRSRVLAEKAHPEGVGLVVVDYIQLLGMERVYRDDNRADAERIQGLKSIAQEADVPVLAITAMTKSAQREAKKGNVDQTGAKGAGTEYAADMMAFLVRTDADDEGGRPEVIFAMTKRRDGPMCNPVLIFDMRRGRFESTAKMHEGKVPEDERVAGSGDLDGQQGGFSDAG